MAFSAVAVGRGQRLQLRSSPRLWSCGSLVACWNHVFAVVVVVASVGAHTTLLFRESAFFLTVTDHQFIQYFGFFPLSSSEQRVMIESNPGWTVKSFLALRICGSYEPQCNVGRLLQRFLDHLRR